MNEKAMQIAIILDRSGSMSSIQSATVEGINAFIADQQLSPAEVSLLLVQFDDVYEQVYSGPAADAPVLTLAEHPIGNQVRFEPRGLTALLDAIGKTIKEVGHALSNLTEENRPSKVVIVIMTDGLENHSNKFNIRQIAEMIRHQREIYKWEFQFLGANQDAIATAAAMSIPMDNSITYAASGPGARSVIASASRIVRDYGASPEAKMPLFKRVDRDAAMQPEEAGQE